MLEVVLLVASFLVSLVAGLLLIFSIVVMPGIGRLDDRDYLRAFRAMDRIIQDNQPVFVLVWGGSVLAVIGAVVLAIGQSGDSVGRLVIVSAVVYLVGVQVSTFAVNIPLNNVLRGLDLEAMSAEEHAEARAAFEHRWNTWNRSRSAWACLASFLLLTALAQI